MGGTELQRANWVAYARERVVGMGMGNGVMWCMVRVHGKLCIGEFVIEMPAMCNYVIFPSFSSNGLMVFLCPHWWWCTFCVDVRQAQVRPRMFVYIPPKPKQHMFNQRRPRLDTPPTTRQSQQHAYPVPPLTPLQNGAPKEARKSRK